jgi:hypothetical protein
MGTNMETENGTTIDKRSKVLLAVFGVGIILSVAVSFYRYMILRDYIIEAQVDCDPAAETCFVTECDPESEDVETMCTGNPTEDVSFYKIIRKNAMNIPVCDPSSEECASLSCAENEVDCEYAFCEEGNVDGVRCSTEEDAAAMAAPADEESDAADVEQDAEGVSADDTSSDEVPSDQADDIPTQ